LTTSIIEANPLFLDQQNENKLNPYLQAIQRENYTLIRFIEKQKNFDFSNHFLLPCTKLIFEIASKLKG
jgi:hypothetical protein